MDKTQVGKCREEDHGDIERDPHLQAAIMEVVEKPASAIIMTRLNSKE